MHGSAGLHSALAIKRQRRLREQAKRRALEKRLSSSTNSIDSNEPRPTKKIKQTAPSDSGLVTSVGMLHLGVCFLVLGIFLIGSGLLPDDMVTWRGGGWWNELVATGLFVAALGIFLISLNRVISKKEEEDLNDYVQRQLTRSRSGHRLERDVETGCLTTKNHRRRLEKEREDKERGLEDEDIPTVQSPKVSAETENFIYQNGEAHLERIVEEEALDKMDEEARRELYKENVSATTTASVSPGTPSETRELLANGRHHHHPHIARL